MEKRVQFFESCWTEGFNSLSHVEQKGFNSVSHVEQKGSILWVMLKRMKDSILWIMLNRRVQFFESCLKEGFFSVNHIFRKIKFCHVQQGFNYLTHFPKKSILDVIPKKGSTLQVILKILILRVIFWKKGSIL